MHQDGAERVIGTGFGVGQLAQLSVHASQFAGVAVTQTVDYLIGQPVERTLSY
jgi:hypothetical protein